MCTFSELKHEQRHTYKKPTDLLFSGNPGLILQPTKVEEISMSYFVSPFSWTISSTYKLLSQNHLEVQLFLISQVIGT